MEHLTAFEKGQIMGALTAGVTVAKTAELFNVSKETVSKVMAACSKYVETSLAERKLHKNKTTPKPNSCGERGNTPLHALDKALSLENQGEEDDDEDMDDEDMNIQRPNEDECEGSSEEQNESEVQRVRVQHSEIKISVVRTSPLGSEGRRFKSQPRYH